MRLMHLAAAALLALFALLAGLFVALVVALTGFGALVARAFSSSSRPGGRREGPASAARVRRGPDDAIEVSATEVPAERLTDSR